MIRILPFGPESKVPVRARAAFFCDACVGPIDVDQLGMGQVLVMHLSLQP
jgi:hypothetical protein